MAKRQQQDDGSVELENTLAQTENFLVWTSRDEEDGEIVYHVELDVLTLHFYSEDWQELVTLIKDAEFASRSEK